MRWGPAHRDVEKENTGWSIFRTEKKKLRGGQGGLEVRPVQIFVVLNQGKTELGESQAAKKRDCYPKWAKFFCVVKGEESLSEKNVQPRFLTGPHYSGLGSGLLSKKRKGLD